jgi:hypothetical protein
MFAALSIFSILLTLVSPPPWESPVPLVWPFAGGAIRGVAVGYVVYTVSATDLPGKTLTPG